jgi:peptidoglycan/LPS O-acetylase OafA/YrhL
MRTTHSLPPAASFLLDLVRFTAALLVVLAHLGHPEVPTGFTNRQILGDIAVPVFFVLSGFVIRYVTLAREHTPREFFIDRAARIYSVAIPAMLLTLAVGAIATRVAPAYYLGNWGDVATHPLARIALNLTFLAQSWGHNTIPFCDTPFWSLSYECLYYLAYGLCFYLRGWPRILALLLWFALAGPQVLFLFPTWIVGCIAYDLYQRLRTNRRSTLLSSILVVPLALVTPYAIERLTPLTNPLTLVHQPPMRASLFALATGIFAAAFMLLTLLLSELIPLAPRNLWVRRFRHLADGTFAIYLMHYPLMVLASALHLYNPSTPARTIVVTVVIVLLLIVAARPLDLLKTAMRTHLRRLIAPRQLRTDT